MEKLKVIKIGGNVLEDASMLEAFVKLVADIHEKVIIVHGGGKTATTISKKLGITPKMLDGRRITSIQDLEVVTMVYAGLMNKKLVSQLQQQNINAIGLSGADGKVISAEKRPAQPIDYGYVGDIKNVDSIFINSLLKLKLLPVFCALTYHNGGLLNTNADTIATEIAIAMTSTYETELIYCFEKGGVLSDDQKTIIPKLDKPSFEQLKQNETIHSGMIPKLDNAFNAVARGVLHVKIGSITAVNSGEGTLIV